MRLPLLAVVVACSNPASGSIAATQTQASASSVVLVPSASASAMPSLDATAVATASASAAIPPPPAPKIVLHLGDSMVGGYGGLTKALEAKFKEAGAKLIADWQVSVSIATFDHEHHLQDLIAKHSPDLILLTLGANDVLVPFPSSLVSNVQSIARKLSDKGRACFWIEPPIWRKDTGIIDVIKKNAAPCKVFDASYMKIARAGDGIHPTDRGGSDWADAFYAFYSGNGPATPNEPAVH